MQLQNGYFFKLVIYVVNCMILDKGVTIMKHKMPLSNILFVLLTCLVWACKHVPKDESLMQSAKVRLEPVRTKQISLPVRSVGMIVSSREIRLSFKTGGIIGRIEADEGARVRKGDILAVLNLSEMEAQVNQVRNGYEKALRDFSRVKNLFADSAATLEQMQNAETALNMAKANLDMVEFNLAHSKIRAPDNGIILKRLAEPSEVIAPGYPVFIFGTEGRFWKIKTGVADRDFVRLEPGDSASVILDAYPDELFRALVSQISESANPTTGTYEIELDLYHTDHKLASGFIANLDIYPSRKETYCLIPIEAIVQAEGQTGYVFVVNDSMVARKLEVKIDAVFGENAAISCGLGGATTVVTAGAAYLTEGDHVEIEE